MTLRIIESKNGNLSQQEISRHAGPSEHHSFPWPKVPDKTQYIRAIAEMQTITERVISELTMCSLQITIWIILTSFTLAYDYFLWRECCILNEIHYYYRSWMEDDNLGVDNRERSNVCWAQHIHALCSPWWRSTEMVEEMQNNFLVPVQSRTEISMHTSNKLCVRESS